MMSGSDGLAGMTSARCKRLIATSAPTCQTARVPRNLILCNLQADQGQSQSSEASVWNEKYVRLRNKGRMAKQKIGRQIECAQNVP